MRIYTLIMLIAAILLVLVVSEMSYNDAVAWDAYYDEMVCAGIWPDYDNLKPDCGKPTTEQTQ